MQDTVQHIDLQRSSLQQSEARPDSDLTDRLAALEDRVADLEGSDDGEARPQPVAAAAPEHTRGMYEVAPPTGEKSNSAAPEAETSGEGFIPPVVGLEFEKQLTDRRVEVVEEWLEHVRQDGRVQKSDFEAWYTDDHADRAGYEPGGFWDFFAKPALRQVDRFEQPNSRTYVWVGTDE
jgi:hypothetical protein